MNEAEDRKPIELNGADAWHLSRVVKHTWIDHHGREVGRELLDKVIEAILHFEDEGKHTAQKIYLGEGELWAIHFLVQDNSYPGAKGLLMQVFRALWELKNERRWTPIGPVDRAREVEARRKLVQLRAQMLLPPGEAELGADAADAPDAGAQPPD